MKRLQGKLNYGNVVSTIALFVALGGATAFAASHLARNSVGTPQLKRNAVTGAKVKDGSLGAGDVDASALGKVPLAQAADRATSAATASSLAPPEAAHLVGTPGEPDFGTGWEDSAPTGEAAAFYKDGVGIVHLQGRILRTTGGESMIFTLPPGYAPADEQAFIGATGAGTGTRVNVTADGAVTTALQANDADVRLDGITWLAGR